MAVLYNRALLSTVNQTFLGLASLLEYSELAEAAEQVRIMREIVLYKIAVEGIATLSEISPSIEARDRRGHLR